MTKHLTSIIASLFLLLIFMLSISFISASFNQDIAYMVIASGFEQSKIINTFQELGLSYDIIYDAQIPSTNFSNYRLLVINNDFFSNWQLIPVNNMKSIIVNGRHIKDWGWVSLSTKSSFSGRLLLNDAHDISKNIPSPTSIYTVKSDVYSLSPYYTYSGLISLATKELTLNEIVVALAPKNTTLTKNGYPDTFIKEDSIFFGITDSKYWTNETKELFKNSIKWVLSKEDYATNLNFGVNLVSIPLIINSIDVSTLMMQNSQIKYVKEFKSGSIVNTSFLENDKAYFIYSDSNFVLNINGETPTNSQVISFISGMNLIGVNALRNLILTELPSEIIEVSKRNIDGSYTIATKYAGGWNNAFNLEPGKGYWMKANSDVTWTYLP